jgi:hypothetical protein
VTEHRTAATENATPPGDAIVSLAKIGGRHDASKALEEIFVALVAKAEDAMEWYESRQAQKKRGARWVRSLAIVLGAMTAIVPSLISLLPERISFLGVTDFAAIRLNPLATIIGVAAATVILFDRFYGFSSSWIRYVNTYLEIDSLLDEFRIGWRKQILKLNANQPPSDEQILAVYDFLLAFLKSVNDAVRAETQSWVTEFRGALGDIDKTVEGQRAAATATAALPTRGALNVNVNDYKTLDDLRWTLQLDNRKEEMKIGQASASIPLLEPGIYKVRTAGARDGKPVAAEFAVVIKAGEITSQTVDKLG